MTNIPRDRRIALCGPCTLDGRPARIGGYGQRFAHVTDVQTGVSVEFSWQAVARIDASGSRAFRS